MVRCPSPAGLFCNHVHSVLSNQGNYVPLGNFLDVKGIKAFDDLRKKSHSCFLVICSLFNFFFITEAGRPKMHRFACLTIIFAMVQVCITAPVQLSETTDTVVATTSTVTANTATVAATTAATTSTSTSSSSSWVSVLKSIYSAITSDSDSDSSSSSSSGTSLSSLLSSLLESLTGGDDDSTSTTADATTTSAATSTTATSTTSSAALLAGLLDTDSTSSSTSAASETSSTSSSSDSIYDAIYNSSEEIDEDFAKAILDAHNEKRALHGVGNLSWASGPYDYAKSNADSYDCSGVLTHTHGQYGENLAAGYSTGPSAVEAWYVEGDTYNYTSHDEYNHFTQLVWKSSTQLGCAYKDCTAEGWKKYIVCEYNPVGNVIGEEEENVLPLVSSS